MYISKIQAYVKFIGMRDGLNPVLTTKCPTQSKYEAIDVLKPENQTLVNLYKANDNYAQSSCWVRVRATEWPF